MIKKWMLLGLVIIAACQKDLEPEDEQIPKTNCRLTKLINGVHNGSQDDTVITFYYNDTGRLERLRSDYVRDSVYYDKTLFYDTEGRLVKIGPDLETIFKYNQRGLLSEVWSNMFEDTTRVVFKYGAGDLPTGSTIYNYDDGINKWKIDFDETYRFENGNMVQKDWVGLYSGSATYEYYDNIPNLKMHCLLSINRLGGASLGLQEEFLFFNKNMIKRSGVYNTVWDVKTDSGRITQTRTNWLSGTDTVMVDSRFYFYDCK